MKQLTISVPDNKFQFIVDLLSNPKFVKIDKPTDNFIISEEQKALVDEEFRKMDEDPNYALDWDEVKHRLIAASIAYEGVRYKVVDKFPYVIFYRIGGKIIRSYIF